ncbi:hypothetical protein [Parvibaculum sp.]|uniref:hypothetical protein n=1 Tax=Parvibaculum sp. TaxID=2024848 RepID=UPI0032F08419
MNTIAIPLLRPDAQPILAGRLDGKRSFARTLEILPTITAPTLVVLDFNGVELATSSFLDEAVIRCRDHLRLGRSPAYLMVANLNAQIEEELSDLLVRANDALVSCTISGNGHIDDKKMLGALEPKLNETLELVKQKGAASAVQLHDEAGESEKKIGPTAWNNRLSSLAAKGLVVEVVQPGRAKKYRPIMEVV